MRDPKGRFTDRVENYAAYRPRYAAELVDVLVEELALPPGADVADIGAGTGFSAEPFLERGHRVLAVEPNAEMRRSAEVLHGGREGFVSVAGSAEATGLEPASVDLVVSAQAFHWFDAVAARAEFLRVLRRPKRAALIWHVRLTRESGFLVEYEELLERFGTDYAQVPRIDETAMARLFQGGYARRSLAYEQRFDYEGLEGRLLFSSYSPPPDHPDHRPMLRALRALFDSQQIGGEVRMLYRTDVYAGMLEPPG